jgi:hypothetical protein
MPVWVKDGSQSLSPARPVFIELRKASGALNGVEVLGQTGTGGAAPLSGHANNFIKLRRRLKRTLSSAT